MNLHNAKFVTSVFNVNKLPEGDKPEIVFSGRSNVGKSSMINKLLNRKNLARTSGVPGKTASINFYDIDDKVWLVDLPGYGYAKVSQEEKTRWGKLMDDYFNVATNIALAVCLIDIRHKPTDFDALMLHLTRTLGIKTVVALTKSDKLSKAQIENQKTFISDALFLGDNITVIPFSAITGRGVEELLEQIKAVEAVPN